MKTVLFYKLLAAGLAVLLLLVGGMFTVLISQAIRELDNFKKQQADLTQQLADKKIELQRNEEFLEKLQTDPDFLERIARLRLGYAKPDELILRFDTDPFTSAPPNQTVPDAPSSVTLPSGNATSNASGRGTVRPGTARPGAAHGTTPSPVKRNGN